MLGILGKKIGMTQIFNEAGEPVPITVVRAGSGVVIRKRTKAKDGYDAICVGFEAETKEKRLTKACAGVFKKAGQKPYKLLKEFKPVKAEDYEVGKEITASALFKKGDLVDVSGTTKGRGFQGVIKRCGKKGGPMAHGSKFHRTTGSVGMRTWPGRVLPGTGMAGQMGNVERTIKNLTVFGTDADKNLVFIEGALPGAKNSVVVITTRVQ